MHAAVHVHRIGVIQVVLTGIQAVEVLNRPLCCMLILILGIL